MNACTWPVQVGSCLLRRELVFARFCYNLTGAIPLFNNNHRPAKENVLLAMLPLPPRLSTMLLRLLRLVPVLMQLLQLLRMHLRLRLRMWRLRLLLLLQMRRRTT